MVLPLLAIGVFLPFYERGFNEWRVLFRYATPIGAKKQLNAARMNKKSRDDGDVATASVQQPLRG
jgi:hypothetical protein